MSIQEPKHKGASWRSIIIGLLLLPLNAMWMALMEVKTNSLDTTAVSLFFHVIFMLLLITAINALVRRMKPGCGLCQGELLTIYSIVSVGSAMGGRDMLTNLLPNLTHPFWYDTTANGYARLMQHIPDWMAVRDKDILHGYFYGDTVLSRRILLAWLPVMVFWVGMLTVLSYMMLCLNAVVRKHWVEEEKLSFPLMNIPMAITASPSPFRSKVFLLGFIIPVLIQSLNYLAYWFPSLPTCHLKLQNVGQYFTTPPWNGLGWFPIAFFPFAIGIAYFLPVDLLFGCWFFYLLRKLIDVGCVAWGLHDPGASAATLALPYVKEQGTGAWLGLVLGMLWLSRTTWLAVFKQAMHPKTGGDDPLAGMSYRAALLGMLVGSVVLTLMFVKAGMSWWLPPLYFTFYFIISIGVTRVRAELGPPAHELNWVNPENFLVTIFGTTALGTQNLTLLSMLFWFNRGYRCHQMPHMLEASYMGGKQSWNMRRLLVAMMLAAVVGSICCLLAFLWVYYRNGEATPRIQCYSYGIGLEAYSRLSDWNANPRGPDGIRIAFIGIGAVITLLLGMARGMLAWWPFPPLAYALANSYALEYFWTTMLIGWVIKLVTLKVGGNKLYKQFQPFFLGLIIGDYVVASAWGLLGAITGLPTYRTFIF
ncbi:MAG: DUF6785 family protein [Armatimonadota bacterium]